MFSVNNFSAYTEYSKTKKIVISAECTNSIEM